MKARRRGFTPVNAGAHAIIRLYPPAGRLERTAKETVEISGITIPKNMAIMVPIFALHRDPEHWPEPEEFKPERYNVLKRSNGGKV